MDLSGLPFSNRPVGWFQIGWSGEFAPGTAHPLRYFGHDLVAFRTLVGELSVLDGHCPHLGAHLGYGGKVKGDCVACPYHGWEWDTEGRNARIPYQDSPMKMSLRKWPVREQHGCVFMWHDPTGAPPRWALPHVFESYPALPGREEDYYPPYGNSTARFDRESVHTQVTMENGVDSVHFRHTHNAPVDPVLEDWVIRDAELHTRVGFLSPATGNVALTLHNITAGVGLSFSAFEGSYHYRLVFAGTPVDDDTTDYHYTIWYPREPGDTGSIMPPDLRQRIKSQFLYTLEEDMLIWRTQAYVPRPTYAKQDIKPYTAMRKWQKNFYNLPPLNQNSA
ncbi:hypothetical protein BSL82_11870 [Tardibacter chloracetimidivorans]|uniref:cholesterol 7-desaturase n=1 Tax=Tardibacter chloracetimidivorans TaxID=1921510 RepID=A0A1L3ZWA5_9SPHN|nr:Rieske 2Fe-2S domain-containing protein [Tardibacter chloracetimidivorans]API59890.1 hypothetical protein BSL82_11680 [Tardibacter chloracetimidivorans]API59921.1 hypothetical protein BSL82_11870 [Tardibacter chloracetimidivorans]